MAMARESAFLPTIKCSQCGAQVEISLMGEHLCSGPSAELSPPLEVEEGFGSLAPPSNHNNNNKPLPVDIHAANQSYVHQGALTPVSQDSPITPFGRPSPALGSDYFASARLTPDGERAGRPPLQIRRPGSSFDAQDGYIREPIPSPGTPSTPGLLRRMDTITPGPFEATRRPSMAEGMRQGTLTPSSYEDLSRNPHNDRPGTSHSNLSKASADSSAAPPRMPRKNGYEGFGPPPPSRGGLDSRPPPLVPSINRAETFPRPSTAAREQPSMQPQPPARTPSAPGTRSDQLSNSNNGSTHARKQSMGPDTSRRPPPRKSLISSAAQRQASVDIAAEFGAGNPYHTPSDSASSGYSSFSHASHTSSQSTASPARSLTKMDVQEQQQQQPPPPPLPPKMDNLIDEVQRSMENLRPRDLRIEPVVGPRTRIVDSPTGLSPNDRVGGISAARRDEDISPMTQSRPLPSPKFGGAQLPVRRDSEAEPRPGAMAPPSRQGSRDPSGLPPYRGDCKACGLAIRGKSVSSADGRLTGKYHKPCFVCTTCSEPFTSAEFYVLGDKPYCEQHYHKLNGSLCGSCNRGIEGHYVEDEGSVKYHVQCFCCLDCGRPLTDGYFEVDGKAYCEQDALVRTQPSPTQQQQQQQQHQYGSYPPAPPLGAGPYHSKPQQQLPRRGAPGPQRPQQYGLPARPGPGQGPVPRPRAPLGSGKPPMSRQGQGQGYGPGPAAVRPAGGLPPPSFLMPPRPMMNKRSTRLGMMGAA